MTQTANIATLRNSDKSGARRNSGLYRELVAISLDTGDKPVLARLYWPGDVTCYCVLWTQGNGRGEGKAAGYGYHKPSAALGAAISDAGIALSTPIGGHGDSAMESAILAIAQAIKPGRYIVHVAHC